jgi:hypothetical protein
MCSAISSLLAAWVAGLWEGFGRMQGWLWMRSRRFLNQISLFQMSRFYQTLRLAPIVFLEIQAVLPRLKLAPYLTSDQLKRFETGSDNNPKQGFGDGDQ